MIRLPCLFQRRGRGDISVNVVKQKGSKHQTSQVFLKGGKYETIQSKMSKSVCVLAILLFSGDKQDSPILQHDWHWTHGYHIYIYINSGVNRSSSISSASDCVQEIFMKIHSLRIQVCPKKGTISTILFWRWDLDHHQSSFRKGFGFLGIVTNGVINSPWRDS